MQGKNLYVKETHAVLCYFVVEKANIYTDKLYKMTEGYFQKL